MGFLCAIMNGSINSTVQIMLLLAIFSSLFCFVYTEGMEVKATDVKCGMSALLLFDMTLSREPSERCLE